MAIAIDASSPANVTQGNVAGQSVATTIVTASFTPPVGSLIVAMAGLIYNGSGTLGSAFNVSDSLGGTWVSNKIQCNPNPAVWAGVFTQVVTSSSAMTVTITTDALQKGKQLTVKVLTGIDTVTPLGNVKSAQSSTVAALQQTCTTSVAGSIYLLSSSYDTTGTIPANGSTTQYNQFADATNGARIQSGQQATATVTPGTVSLGWTGDATTTPKAYMGVEILPLVASAVDPWPVQVFTQQSIARASQW